MTVKTKTFDASPSIGSGVLIGEAAEMGVGSVKNVVHDDER